ncbi:MAG: phosphopyruvate hydratase [Phycisphaerales bacterium]|nr:phosphopyruvate hydratase [Phycisphaerales bacterium]
MKIQSIAAYQIYDSRGVPTIETEVKVENGGGGVATPLCGVGTVPSGASTGQFEALELRDKNPNKFRGKSVFNAIHNVEQKIAPAIVGQNIFDQEAIDRRMIELDGTPDKSRLGANAILSVSMAVANAAAKAKGVALFESLGKGEGTLLPLPEIQIIGGGAHANWRTDVQDFLLIATGAKTYDDVMEITHNVYHAAGDILRSQGKYFGIADEGGYWPEVESNEEVFDLMLEAIRRAGYTPGKEAAISLDIAASDLYDESTQKYAFRMEKREFSRDAFADLMIAWCNKYPIVSIEDPAADVDTESWKKIRQAIGDRVQLIGDDLFTTNVARIQTGIDQNLTNAVLIKLNQIGTVTETLEAIRMTQKAGWRPVISARSGETEDAFIAHLAVATNAGQLKVGSWARSERMCKWNEVIRIARILGQHARFIGKAILPG